MLPSPVGVALILVVSVFAFREAELRREADEQCERAEHGQYVANIQLATERLAEGRTTEMRRLLLDTAPHSRNWEWGYLVNRAWPRPARGEILEPELGQTAGELWRDAAPRVVKTLVGHEGPSHVQWSKDAEGLYR